MRLRLAGLLAVMGGLSCWLGMAQERVVVDAKAGTTPFPHFWEQTFGSGRAILSLRDEYRVDMDTVHEATGFESVRFHGIFMDEVGIYDPARTYFNPGQTVESVRTDGIYNFSYVDQIYDGLLERHVRPYVELSFMPKGLASDPNALHPFWYHPNISPPKDLRSVGLDDECLRAAFSCALWN